MQIKAAIARAQGADLSLETIDIEEPRDNENLVKVIATGVCHTDIVVRDGMLPTPLPSCSVMKARAWSRRSAARCPR